MSKIIKYIFARFNTMIFTGLVIHENNFIIGQVIENLNEYSDPCFLFNFILLCNILGLKDALYTTDIIV